MLVVHRRRDRPTDLGRPADERGVDGFFEPPGWPFVGQIFEALDDPMGLIMRGMASGAPAVRYRFGPVRYVLVNDPEDIGRILLDPAGAYRKSSSYEPLRLILGDGLLTSEGPRWRRQRKLMQPAFHRRSLTRFVEQMARVTGEFADALEQRADGRALDVHEQMMQLTFRIVGHTLFSTDLSGAAGDVGPALGTLLDFAARRAESPVKLPTWIPTFRHVRFKRALRIIDDVVAAMIHDRSRDPSPPLDLLGVLMSADMSDRALRDELVTLALAGHETTATALSWTWLLLSRHPSVVTRLRAEIDREVGDRPLTASTLDRLTLTDRVIRESMRLYPPVWGIERQAQRPDTIAGLETIVGDVVLICPYALHRDPRFWPDPERFEPDRFQPDLVDARPRYSYLPFGGGPRVCIGKAFAMQEAKIVIAALIRRFELSLEPGFERQLDPGITLRPKNGIRMSVTPRRG